MRSAGSPAPGSLGEETQADSDIGHTRHGESVLGAHAQPGAILGRYVVIDLLGSGGMGAVYRAYDPELDRIVALKLVRVERDSAHGRARLQREAQAIARLSHVNVVQVFDAGADARTGAVFIAMEYVPGTTLGRWLTSKRSLSELFEVFRQAGEGLRAAHRKEIVHRDFKPDNVLISEDGVAKVLDFGLAKPISRGADSTSGEGDPVLGHEGDRAPGIDSLSNLSVTNPGNLETRAESSLDPPSASGTGRRNLLSDKLTRDGAAVGTPAYMPPEQMRGEESDARADQYSFAVALYEALFRRLPFSSGGAQEYMLKALDGDVRPIPSDSRVPRSLQRAILRALKPDPGARFDSLDPLLLELARHPDHERRRRWAWAGGIMALLASLAGGFVVTGSQPDDPRVAACEAVADRAQRQWTDERRTGIHEAIAAAPRDHARSTADLVDASLDKFVEQWSAAELRRCLEADDTANVAIQVEEAFTTAEAKIACLERSALRFEHLLVALEDPSTAAVDRAVEAIDDLRRESSNCGDPTHLSALRRTRSRNTPETESMRSTMVEIDDHQRLGNLDRAQSMLDALPRPPDDGSWPADLALAWSTVQAAQGVETGDYKHAKRALEHGNIVTMGAPAPLSALAWLDLHGRVCTELGEFECSATMHRRAHALAESIYGEHHATTLEFRSRLGDTPYAAGDYLEALELYESAATAASEQLPQSHSTVLWADHSLATVQIMLGRYEDAIPLLESVHARAGEQFGKTHPQTVSMRFSIAQAYLGRGDSERALTEYRALAEPQSPTVDDRDAAHGRAVALTNIGGALIQLERPAEAIPPIVEAHELMLELTGGEESAETMAIKAQLAAAHQANGSHDDALGLYRACMSQHEESGTQATRNGIMVAHGLARALAEGGRRGEALEVIGRAIERVPEGGDAELRAKLESRRVEIRTGSRN